MTFSNRVHPHGLRIGFEIEKPPVSLSYNLSLPLRSTMVHENGSKTVLERQAGDSLLAYLPYTKGVTEAPAGHLTSLSISIAQPTFRELFTVLPDCLSALGAPHFIARQSNAFYYQSTIDLQSRFAILQIVQCPYHGDARKVFLEAKVLELIAHQLAKMGRIDHGGPGELSSKELDHTRRAYGILLDRIERPASLQDLSLMVGLNRNKLNQGFKQLYGGTVFKVLRDARLARSLLLLQDTDLSLADIALQVGYSDQANFSNAFRKHFGQTPRTVRRKGLNGR
jgi:AraC-like DNA-binding protein